MISYNQSFLSTDTDSEEVPLIVTYLNMVVVLMVATVVITPAVMVINVIWWTMELHTKYYFFVANLLATNIAAMLVQSILQYLIMIIYLLNAVSNSTAIAINWSVILLRTLLHLMTVMLPITLAAERMIVIGFPYRHRSIMTTKIVATILAAMWGLSTILAIIIIVVVPVDIVWPISAVDWDVTFLPFVYIPRLTSAVFIIVANAFLHYKVTASNRNAKENERLGNEEEVKKFNKLSQLFRVQTKATITLLLLGGIDVIANMLLPLIYVVINLSVCEPSMKVYIEQFVLYPLRSSLLLSHPLVYGLYMKKIRKRLPNCVPCQGLWNNCKSRVVTLHQQPRMM